MIFADKILTPRLSLRKMTEADLPLFIEWSNSEVAHGNHLTPDQMSSTTGRELLRAGTFWHEKNRFFLIEPKENGGEPIGTLHYWLRPENQNCAVMAVKISYPHMRNNGYGTEAQKYLIIQIFERVKLKRIEMYTDINNASQQRCLKKLGFDLVESLNYADHHVRRVGHLFRLEKDKYARNPFYQYHYEE